MKADSSPDNPFVFVVGAPRSGTTLVLRMLVHGQPQVAGAERESQLYTSLTARRHARESYADDPYFTSLLSPDEIDRLVTSSREPVAFFRNAARHVLARDGKRRFVEKSPVHLLHWREIVRDFDAPRILLVERDPRAVVHSMTTARWSHLATDCLPGFLRRSRSLRYIAAMFKYHLYTRESGALRRYPGCLAIRYEDVVGRNGGFREVLEDWLGVPLRDLWVSRPFSAEAGHRRYELDESRLNGFETACPRWVQRTTAFLFAPRGRASRVLATAARGLLFGPLVALRSVVARFRGSRV